MSDLILASSSPHRRALLERLQLPFQCVKPGIDEAALAGEKPIELVQRLAQQKAFAVADQYPNHFIIGSDQVALINGKVLTKPGNFDNAAQQLRQQSGQRVQFYTGLALYDSAKQRYQTDVISTEVAFRVLSEQEIGDYLEADKPWGCAGSFKAEGLGISLFDGIYGSDPTALIGLPLIRLSEMLRNA